jgi:predicted membrane protein
MMDFDKDPKEYAHRLKESIHRDIHDRMSDQIRHRAVHHPPAQGMILGAAICAVGVALLLDHMGVVAVGNLWRFWPLLLIVAGTVNLTESGKQAWGALLLVVGVLFQLDNLGYIHFRIADLWPLAIIAAGVAMIWGSFKARQFKTKVGGAANAMNATSVFGGVERRVGAKDFKYGSVSAVFGGVELDFRDAEMEGEEAVMDINVIFGGVEIRVPDHWRVEARNQSMFAGYTDTTRGTGNPPAGGTVTGTKTLVITGQVLFGGIEVKN